MASKIEYYNEDCMVGMARYPDKYFDLAIVDPPYGIGCDGNDASTGGHGGRKAHTKKTWDKDRPSVEYFRELYRVSSNQIIWGANYYPEHLSGTMGWVFWDKGQTINQSDGELAFTSFDRAFRRIVINRCELLKDGTIHPAQKPVKLYKWLLTNYAKKCDKILDTHVGSASSLIACYDLGFDAVGFELDPDYYAKSKQRIEDFMRQPKIEEITITREQITL